MNDYTFLNEICDDDDYANDESDGNIYHIAANALNESSSILSEARKEIENKLKKENSNG